MDKTYNAQQFESTIYQDWEKSGAFKPVPSVNAEHSEAFSIVLPPPNATGQLHLGHSMMLALEDLMVRYWRMRGRETVWIPGTDHAAISTEAVVLRQLVEAGHENPRLELGRDKVLEAIAEFVDGSRSTINSQVRAMGASVDWSRERYTMDPPQNRLVSETFKRMYDDGIIYRGDRIVNWDPKLQSTVSDDEVNRVEETTKFYTLQYGPFQIGTARPETKFGDKYVVVHPDDDRYKEFTHGQQFQAEWINGPITATVIKDTAIDMSFGTGAMTITPWHDATDFEIAERHDLPKEQVIGFDGRLLEVAGEFAGMTIEQARPEIANKLQQLGLLVEVKEDYVHSAAISDRGKVPIEPQIMRQWWVDVNKKVVRWKGRKHSIKEVMQDALKSNDITIIPDRFEKNYFHWIDNLQDWCISRQIWWGHRIPAWYRGDEVYVGLTPPEDAAEWLQDPDTLDTWFSSALWTWSTLVDQEKASDVSLSLEDLLAQSPDFQKYHPTTVLETGYDLIFFWIARMILSTTYMTGQVPFKTVYMHGMVQDNAGKKMSKSHPETTIDPLDIIPEFGADALRLSMVIGQSPGSNSRLYKEKIEGYRNFCNKIWNVARYVLTDIEKDHPVNEVKLTTPAEHWIFGRTQQVVTEVSKLIEDYRFSDAGQEIYHFLWNDFADWYIEVSKVEPNQDLSLYVLETVLKLAHPFAPFVTESIWRFMPSRDTQLIVAPWPVARAYNSDDIAQFEELKNVIGEIRALTSKLDLKGSYLYYKQSSVLDSSQELITHLTKITGVKQVSKGQGIYLMNTKIEAWLDAASHVTENFVSTLTQELGQVQKQIDASTARLGNKAYVKGAPKEIVQETKDNLKVAQESATRLNAQIESLQGYLAELNQK